MGHFCGAFVAPLLEVRGLTAHEGCSLKFSAALLQARVSKELHFRFKDSSWALPAADNRLAGASIVPADGSSVR